MRLTTVFDRLKSRGSNGELHFRRPGAISHLIDLTDKVTY